MNRLLTLIAACGLLAAPAAAADEIPDLSGQVLTVNGPVAPQSLGIALMHEHIFINFPPPLEARDKWLSAGLPYPETPEAQHLWHQPLSFEIMGRLDIAWPANKDALTLTDEALAVDELNRFKAAGGGTVVELTSIGLGRNPGGLRRVAAATGLNIVMGGGWYRDEWLPEDVNERSIESLASQIVREITVGVDGGVNSNGIRAGIIGEVGVESHPPGDPLTANEIKSLRAAARAAMATGAPLSLHTLLTPGDPLTVLDVLADEGMDLSRVIMGHMNATIVRDEAYMLAIAERGVYLEFDLLGFRESTAVSAFVDDRTVASGIMLLLEKGYGDRVLLSHDTAIKLQLVNYGGYGYGYIPTHFLPHLEERGLSKAQINMISVKNPARALTFAKPGEQQ